MMDSRSFEAALVNKPTAFLTSEVPINLSRSGNHEDTCLRENWSRVNKHLVHSQNNRDIQINESGRELDRALRGLDDSPNTGVNRRGSVNILLQYLYGNNDLNGGHPLFGKSDGLEAGEIIADFVPPVSVRGMIPPGLRSSGRDLRRVRYAVDHWRFFGQSILYSEGRTNKRTVQHGGRSDYAGR